MLNLVQLQERLKDVPMQALMQYANGSNPQIPPFLALGELNRRKKMQETAAAEEAKQMAGAPSIKEQIEQATGLMALQGARQRQAAQQQAGMQSRMDMPAPNTMTSEPAQMASGGAVNDVMGRDYESGGMVSPDIAQKMAMLMQRRRPGVAGIPIPDTFKRADYAKGGIVAFSGKESSFVDPVGTAPYERVSEEERRLYDPEPKSIFRRIAEMVSSGDPDLYKDKEKEKAKNRPEGLSDKQQSVIEDARDQAMTDLINQPRRSQAAPQARPSPGAREDRGIAALQKPKFDYEKMFPVPADFDEEKQFQKQQSRKERYGVSDKYLSEAEAELAKRIANQEARRGRQGMDQAIEFLTSVAEGRGGNWATQGARGVKAAQKLRAEQEAANERQDEANAALRMAVAEKRQALARGDMAAAEAAEKDIRAAQMEARKAQFDVYRGLETLDVQKLQARAAMRDPVEIQVYNLWRSQQPAGSDTSFDAYWKAKSMTDERLAMDRKARADKALAENMEYKILSISDKPEDRRKAEAIKMRIYAEAGIPVAGGGGGTGSGLPPGVVVSKIAP